jgi:hypothetical protein
MEQPLKNSYQTVVLPLDYNKSFLELDQREISEYYQWFLDVKSQRALALCEFLFVNGQKCPNEKDLHIVEMFLVNSVSVKDKPIEVYRSEAEKIPPNLKPFAKPDSYLLDDKTISICFDVGIYLGELMISLDNKISWKLETRDDFSDFGQPILAKKGCKFDVNPFRVTKNMAAKIYENRYVEGQIISAFNVWKKGFGIL